MIRADKEGKAQLDEVFGVAQKVISLDSLGELVALRDSIKLIERPEGDIDG
jgi:hypothetical protein